MSAKESGGQAAATAAPAAASPKSPVQLLLVVGIIMAVEAAGVYGLVTMLGHNPASAAAKDVQHGEGESEEAPVEIPLVDEKFQNLSTNKVWLWDIAVYLKVRRKHEPTVTATLKKHEAEIKEGVSLIVRRASHNQLKEPGLETLNRQVTAFVNDIVGSAPDGSARIDRVLIPRCRGFPAD